MGNTQPDMAVVVVPPDQDPPVTMTYTDFPATPVLVDNGLPANLPTLFNTPVGTSMASGPCLTEPPIDALYPKNWTPPLFEWSAPAPTNIYELRVHIANQTNDLLVYTSQSTYTLPASIWTALATDSAGFNMTLTLRGAQLSGGKLVGSAVLGSTGQVHIAPAVASGAVVYWSTAGVGALNGFHIGDTQLTTVVTPALLNDGTTCVGCHALAPDGQLVFFGRNIGNTNNPFSIDASVLDGTAAKPTTAQVSQNALNQLARTDQTLPTFSPAHYSSTDSVVITELTDANGLFQLTWTDLHAQSGGTGTLLRTGDSKQAASPAWSNDGTTIAYTSTDQVTDGRPRVLPADIYTVPYNNHTGGTATPLPGASEAAYSEYYPTYSSNDALIAFDRVASGTNMYNEPTAEIYLVPGKGGTALRHRGNDPAACGTAKSPGVTNSWPRWAPSVTAVGDFRYYWLVFSSTRRSTNPNNLIPQIFIAGVVTQIQNGQEVVWKTYPAVYLVSQDPTQGNHTPAWGQNINLQ